MKKLHVLFATAAFGLVAHFAPANAAPSGLAGLNSGRSATTAEKVHWRPYRHHHRRYYRRHRPGISLYFGSPRRGYRHRHHRHW